jgi:hypothetical protein
MNGQVCRIWEDQSEPTDRQGSMAAMADSNDILLLRVDIPGFYLPPILLVCCNDIVFYPKELTSFIACDTVVCSKNLLLPTGELITSGFFSSHP